MSAAITAPVKLAGYFLEWDGIETEKAALAERSKDLFKAMKDEGYNTKAARFTFRDKRAEQSATAKDVAKADRGLADRAHPAPARVEKIEEFDAETGKITEQPETATERLDDLGSVQDGLKMSTDGQRVETLSISNGGRSPQASVTAGETATQFQAKASEDNGRITGEAGPVAGEVSRLASGRTDAGEAASAGLPTISDAEVPAFLKKDHPVKTARDYQPHCQNPEACAASGLHHCYTCAKALAAESEAA